MEVDVIDGIEVATKDECTGCEGCANACEYGAISMESDEKGFRYPLIDRERCISCGVCVSVCPVMNGHNRAQVVPLDVKAAWSCNDDVRVSSTSGGVFFELAASVIENGGIVVGARYGEKLLVEHFAACTMEELPQLMQSKYVQSRIGSVYLQVKKFLESGKKVLFVGTPCQCAGLFELIGRGSDQLLLCDFICRGVNAPAAYQAYLKELEQKYDSKAIRVWFKNKDKGWNHFGTKICFENGSVYFGDRETDDFMYGYIKKDLNLYLRPSCHHCQFKGGRTVSDITLGDFWGITHEEDIEKGVSAIILNTARGRQEIERLQHIFAESRDMHELCKGNRCYDASAPESGWSTCFWQHLNAGMPFSQAIADIKEKCDDVKERK